MTSWTPTDERELGHYAPVKGKVSFPQVPESLGRYVNLITMASGASNDNVPRRSQVVAELAMALANMGKSVLVLDTDERGDVYERLGAAADIRPPDIYEHVLRTGLGTSLPTPRPGIWIAKVAVTQRTTDRGLRSFLRRARLDFDYVVASVSPATNYVYRFGFHSGLLIVVDPCTGPLLSSTAIRETFNKLRIDLAPELFLLLRDPQGDDTGAETRGPATHRFGSSGSPISAWESLPAGEACTPDGRFDIEANVRAASLMRLASAIVDRSGASKRAAELAVDPEQFRSPSGPSWRTADASTPVEALRRSLERPSSHRCSVVRCKRRAPAGSAFCKHHVPGQTRVSRYAVRRSGVEVTWYPRCQASECFDPTSSESAHCWTHERAQHPERVCRAAGCDDRASDVKLGGTYCWEHDSAHNPHYPYASSRDRLTSWLILLGFWLVFLPVAVWAVIFAFQFLTLDVPFCRLYGIDWGWFGPECHM
jgi:hypothetical protein